MIPAHAILGTPEAGADLTAWFLHGILGSGNNWRGFARRLLERAPGWRVALVDLRNHGDSVGAAPPHDLAACAEDLWELAALLGTPATLVAHSFGGKVALTFAGQAARRGRTGPGGLSQVWVLDAMPSPFSGDPRQDSEVTAVLRVLRAIPLPLHRREDLVTLLQAQGFSSTLSRWMTTNLRQGPGGFTWRFDLDACEEMIADYFRRDLWPVLRAPGPGLRIDVVRAEHSPRWSPEELARFAELPPREEGEAGVALHLLPDSGHWVHVDAPEALLGLLLPGFLAPAPGSAG